MFNFSSIPFIGEIFSLACAVIWGFSVVLFKKVGETVSPIALNPFKSLVGIVLFGVTLVVLGVPFIQPIVSDPQMGFTLRDYLILTISGVIGIGLADTIFFKSLNILGASIAAIVDCLYSPSIIVFAYFMLGERLAPVQLAGGALIVVSVLFASLKIKHISVSRKQFEYGVFLGAISMIMMAFSIVLIKPILNRIVDDPSLQLWVGGFRMIPGVIVAGGIFLIYNRKRNLTTPFKSKKILAILLIGSVLGGYLALAMWIFGMTLTKSSIAGILNQTSVIFMVLFGWWILKEPITKRRIVAFLMALFGILLVFLGK
ncbi:DMT family transporter [bacterium]|nr:DMT family transporter [bacterium]